MHVVAAAGAGDAVAVGLLRERSRMTGRAAALLLDVLNPERVVVTEVGALYRADCLAALRAEVGAERAECVAPSGFPDSVPAMAGGAVVLDVLYRDPFTLSSRAT